MRFSGAKGKRSGSVGFSFTGIEKLSRELSTSGELHARVMAGAKQGMIEVSEDLLGRAMRDAPLDEGTLRGSGTAAVYVDGQRVSSAGVKQIGPERHAVAAEPEVALDIGQSVVGIVGFNTVYALAQHERMDYEHPKGGKAKYLEDPLKQQGARYIDHMATRMREAAQR
jgi:hypothetical protein